MLRKILLGTVTVFLCAQALAEGLPRALPPQPLADALDNFAQLSGLQVIYRAELATGLKSKGSAAGLNAEDALRELLRDTGLTFTFVNDRMVAIRSADGHDKSPISGAGNDVAAASDISLVQANTSYTSSVADTAKVGRTSSQTAPEKDDAQEIVVTGTHIRGVQPVGAPLIVIDAEEIRSSGYGRLQDYMEMMPQNFAGSVSEDWNSDTGASNRNYGQSVNLRGAGASSTLVLVNGRRRASGGLDGAFVDISSIPLAAVERVEVLTDGASAVYGSDAIAGVVNFVLRNDYEGIETNARFATSDGAADEYQASIMGGHSWRSGNALFGYQYSRRDMFMNEDAAYFSKNFDYRSLGGDDFRFLGGSPGVIVNSSGGAAFGIPAGQNGRGLTAASLIPGQASYEDRVTGQANLPRQTIHSAFFSATSNPLDWLELYVDGNYSHRDMFLPFGPSTVVVSVPSTNPYYVSPSGTAPVSVNYTFENEFGLTTNVGETQTYGASTGARLRFGSDWEMNAGASYGRERNKWEQRNLVNSTRRNACLTGLTASGCPGAPLNVFGDGATNDPVTLDFIRQSSQGFGISEVSSVSAIASGSMIRLPAGLVKIAVGADYRDEQLNAGRSTVAPSTGAVTVTPTSIGKLDRQVSALFAEIVAPLIPAKDSKFWNRGLDLSLAERYEDYSDFGSTSNPKIGINYFLFDGMKLRASWGTSFRAPRWGELSPNARPFSATVSTTAPDPKSPTGRGTVIVLNGGNPQLKEETADVWSAGFDFTPASLDALTLSLTYFNLDYQDKIAVGGQGTSTLSVEERWAEIITRNPTQQQINAICGTPGFSGTCPNGAAAIIDGRIRNLASVEIRNIDLSAKYAIPTALGDLSIALAGTYTLDYQSAVSLSAIPSQDVNTVGFPVDLRYRGTVAWSTRGWQLNSTVNHTDHYRDIGTGRKVNSWTTLDAGVGYRFEQGVLSGANLRLSATNLFDKAPPFVNRLEGYDGANANERGRSIGIEISKAW